MKTLLKALLIAGLFLSVNLKAAQIGGIDFNAGNYPPGKVDKTVCTGFNPALPTNDPNFPKFQIDGKKNGYDCTVAATKKYQGEYMAHINKNAECPALVVSVFTGGFDYQPRYMYTNAATGARSCQNSGGTVGASVGSSVVEWILESSCPPELTGNPIEDAKRKDYIVLGFLPNSQTKVCFKPLPPLDCSKLSGIAATGQDSFITNTPGYTNPSCVTKCGTDAGGQQQCGNCKVIAKSWIQTPLGGDMKKWYPQVGTFTGAACADNEQDVPPPEPPKCWVTKNNLKMCQQDPAEKCVTINGVQQCESGCGYINGDFFCQDKNDTVPPKRTDDDKPLPQVDDSIDNPEKPMADMVKGDFKDVQKGVESRLAVVSTGIGNLENSVDTGNQILQQIEENTEGALADNQTQIGLLGDIKDALSGNGECDPATDPNCTPPPCDPAKDNCDDFDTGAPKSWWNSKYPDGLQTLFANKKASFMSSDAYQAMTGDGITDSGGGATQWQICLPFGFADYGCHTLEISPAIWAFIRACILFGAAILCRRMLIGA
ncbi:hypothetical protein [Rheinheimera texasensis]|uniref:hypothetical protein n=1 Tax=Rheinheimera texasensis TaxID=306205 RepID=UPI0032B30AEF